MCKEGDKDCWKGVQVSKSVGVKDAAAVEVVENDESIKYDNDIFDEMNATLGSVLVKEF